MRTNACKICDGAAESDQDPYFPTFTCHRCGRFDYPATTLRFEPSSKTHQLLLSAWVREQNAAGIAIARINPDTFRRLENMRLPQLRERANRVLRIFARKYPLNESAAGITVVIGDQEILALSCSALPKDVEMLLTILIEAEMVKPLIVPKEQRIWAYQITAKGMLAADEMQTPAIASFQGFVAMNFHPSMDTAWSDGFDKAIKLAGYRPLRIDNKEFLGGISDEIIAEIRRSRFLVADYTGQKNGVYFEAGFALGLGIPVIPACRKDEIAGLHFDIRHINTLVWDEPGDLAHKLQIRIRAVIGEGPFPDSRLASPP